MGNSCCPPEVKKSSDNDTQQLNVSQAELFVVSDPEAQEKMRDKIAVEVLKAELRDDPETFILNLLLMSYMFFNDFDEEVRVLHHTISQKAQELNSTLIQNHKKQFLMPDSILESVNKRVKFEYAGGPKKGLIEPLATQRLFIMHDNVEISERNDGYTTIDKPHYRANVVKSKDNTGFVNVNILDTTDSYSNFKRPSIDSTRSSLTASSIKGTGSKYNSYIKKSKKRKSITGSVFIQNEEFIDTVINDSGMSTAGNSDPENDYSRITAAQTPKPIDFKEVGPNSNSYQLPRSCVLRVKEKNVDVELDSEEDDDDDQSIPTTYFAKKNSKNIEASLFVYKSYLNSIEFMKHFQNTVFPNYIGKLLGFSRQSIQYAKSIPGAMFCSKKDHFPLSELGRPLENLVEYEVIPAIAIPWLHDYAFEWCMRRRPTVSDKSKLKDYKWPTQKMIQEANNLHSIIVPKGFMPKKHVNQYMHMEWEVRFPKIERYLELRMSHAQIRVFLYILILFKRFIEPPTQKHGLLVEHIRYLMFWECEANYIDWLEDKLGNKLKAVLGFLYKHMSKSELSHYFVRTKNVFENVPRKYLIANQAIIHEILEFPVVHILTALKDLKYSSKNSFPQPNIEELEDIFKSKNVLNISHPMFENIVPNQRIDMRQRRMNPKENYDKSQLWTRKYYEIKQKEAKKQQEIKEDRNENPKMDSKGLCLDENINFKKIFGRQETARQILLLTFFIKHFIEIGQKSISIPSASTKQAMFYLKQAWYLTQLLEEINSEIKNAKMFQLQIRLEEENCMKKTHDLLTPQSSTKPIFQSNILLVKGKGIDLSNLNSVFNSTNTAQDAKASTSREKKKSKSKRPAPEIKDNNLLNVEDVVEDQKIKDANLTTNDGQIQDLNAIDAVLEETEDSNDDVFKYFGTDVSKSTTKDLTESLNTFIVTAQINNIPELQENKKENGIEMKSILKDNKIESFSEDLNLNKIAAIEETLF